MTTVLRAYPASKNKVSVGPVQWLPGALSSTLPLFSVTGPQANTLYLRADDPNIYGVSYLGLQQSPVVTKNGVTKAANKGYNFYSAPWCIGTFPARDIGARNYITSVDQSVYDYITALYSLIGTTNISLANWQLEQSGYTKTYQLLQGSSYVNVSGTTYFGGAAVPASQVAGVPSLTTVTTPLISDDFTYNTSAGTINTLQMPYNTFCAVDTPIVISAVDTNNPTDPRIYFTLLNNVTMYNGPNYS